MKRGKVMVLTGRAVTCKKYCVEECSAFDLKDLNPYMKNFVDKQEVITYDSYGNESKYILKNPDSIDFSRDNIRVELKYSVIINATEEVEQINYYVKLTRTPCNYGGYRWWFICPNINCGKRVEVLYRSPISKYYACRHCHNLTYRSRQDHRSLFDRLFRNPFVSLR